jgi:hypothetical protein
MFILDDKDNVVGAEFDRELDCNWVAAGVAEDASCMRML